MDLSFSVSTLFFRLFLPFAPLREPVFPISLYYYWISPFYSVISAQILLLCVSGSSHIPTTNVIDAIIIGYQSPA